MSMLGLSSSDEDEPEKTVIDAPSHVSSSNIDNDLGLDSDSDDEDQTFNAQIDDRPKTEAAEQKSSGELETFTYNIPKLPVSNDEATVHMTRLPNILGFRQEEFTPESFTESEDGQNFTRNLVMWRYKKDIAGNIVCDNKDQKPIRESNSRLVKWSDGSMQLFVGHEVFEVAVLPAEHSYLFVKQTPADEKTILECQNEISNRLQFQPSSLSSDAHKKLTNRVRLENQKTARIKGVATMSDPERVKAEREKQERLRRKKTNASRKPSNSNPYSRRPSMDKRYLEDDIDRNYDQDSINAIKSHHRDRDGSIYGNESDDSSNVTSDSDSPPEDLPPAQVSMVEAESESDDSAEDEVITHTRKRPRNNQFDNDDE